MKKFFITAMLAVVMVTMTACGKTAWKTEMTTSFGGDNWTTLISAKGETIYDGPSEYVDEEYERDALAESKYNFIWNTDKKDFDKVERGSCVFNQ